MNKKIALAEEIYELREFKTNLTRIADNITLPDDIRVQYRALLDTMDMTKYKQIFIDYYVKEFKKSELLTLLKLQKKHNKLLVKDFDGYDMITAQVVYDVQMLFVKELDSFMGQDEIPIPPIVVIGEA